MFLLFFRLGGQLLLQQIFKHGVTRRSGLVLQIYLVLQGSVWWNACTDKVQITGCHLCRFLSFILYPLIFKMLINLTYGIKHFFFAETLWQSTSQGKIFFTIGSNVVLDYGNLDKIQSKKISCKCKYRIVSEKLVLLGVFNRLINCLNPFTSNY